MTKEEIQKKMHEAAEEIKPLITTLVEALCEAHQKGYLAGVELGVKMAYPQWIPVEEELPPENGKTQQSISVWATNGLTSGEFRYNFDTKTWTDMWGDPFDITHWMPLPQLPRKEE